MRLIDADALKETVKNERFSGWGNCCVEIDNAPTVDAVPVTSIEQLKWERDTAIEQLEEHGIPFCGKAEDVVRVVRCKDCKFYSRCTDHQGICTNRYMDGFIVPDWYCADGERKDDEAD